jgi:hypothetical protein
LDLAAFVLAAGVVGIELGEEFEFLRPGLHFLFVFIELVLRQFFDIVAGLGVNNDLAQLDLRFVEDAFVGRDFVKIIL